MRYIVSHREYQGTKPLAFVLSLNLARRHLNSSQCAFVALEVERVLAEEAKERQALNAIINQPQNKSLNPEKIPDSEKGESRDKAASLVGGTNARYIQDAKKIEREAPEVKELVMAGTVNMTDAVKLTKLEPAKRAVAVERIKQGESPKDNILH